jgi:hypothetical protein
MILMNELVEGVFGAAGSVHGADGTPGMMDLMKPQTRGEVLTLLAWNGSPA